MSNRSNPIVCVAFLSAVALGPAAGESDPLDASTEFYHVVGNQVDVRTFAGWKLFHDTCVNCHGVGGTGSSLAPDLTASIKRFSPAEFDLKVLNRYLIVVPSDEAGSESGAAVRQAFITELAREDSRRRDEQSMPMWKNDPAVRENIANIYRYLKARSDGVLGPDRPEILNE